MHHSMVFSQKRELGAPQIRLSRELVAAGREESLLRYSKEGDTVLDPMVGGGTTLIECLFTGRKGLGVDINPAKERLRKTDLFCDEIAKVAGECWRVLKPGRFCAVLVGDTRRKKIYIPLAYKVMNRFLSQGFYNERVCYQAPA